MELLQPVKLARPREAVAWLVAVASLVTVAVMLGRDRLGIPGSSRAFLVAASTGFVLTRIVRRLHTRAEWLLLVGLIGCWLGDWLGPVDFLGSVVAFGAAHLLFIGAFTSLGISARRALAATVPVLLVGVAIGWWLLPHVGAGERGFIVAYMLVISAMVTCAWGMEPGPGRAMLIAAATLFYVSDVFVARWRFVAPGPENALVCYPLYYASCLLVALSRAGHDGRDGPL
ncbi:MAG: lysoplasmalogenase [Armatimonadota bacterium]